MNNISVGNALQNADVKPLFPPIDRMYSIVAGDVVS